jgi:hypothetical protein
MDAMNTYADIVEKVLTPYTAIPYAHGELACEAVFDRARGRFVLMTVGWDQEGRVHFPLVHIDLIAGKIWIQADNTDAVIASQLVEAGIPKDHIVLGFRSPEVRQLTEFAVA